MAETSQAATRLIAMVQAANSRDGDDSSDRCTGTAEDLQALHRIREQQLKSRPGWSIKRGLRSPTTTEPGRTFCSTKICPEHRPIQLRKSER
jgi:hypothetical protein